MNKKIRIGELVASRRKESTRLGELKTNNLIYLPAIDRLPRGSQFLDQRNAATIDGTYHFSLYSCLGILVENVAIAHLDGVHRGIGIQTTRFLNQNKGNEPVYVFVGTEPLEDRIESVFEEIERRKRQGIFVRLPEDHSTIVISKGIEISLIPDEFRPVRQKGKLEDLGGIMFMDKGTQKLICWD
ncbi:hypothetical protein HY990_05620 [Candidatus Micrarchaeota archaeon]|nr:hypothetical protein [Candidatus Micrarchaeota archaeon]